MTTSSVATLQPAIQRRTILTNSLLSLGDVFSFALPFLQFVQIQAVGVLLASDIIVLAALPIAILRHPERLRQKPMPTILALGAFWLVSQAVTDVVRHSAPEDYLRGWSKIVLVLVNLTVLWLVVTRSRRRLLLYGFGVVLGGTLTLYFSPSDQMIDSPWKFGLSFPLTLLVVLYVARSERGPYLRIGLPLAILMVVHSFANTRSLALICLLTVIFSLFQKSSANKPARMGGLRLALLAATVGVCVLGFVELYSHYAQQGLFGEYAQQKLEAQNSGEGGLLLGGRGEILASGQAVLDSPFLGHGSWAQDPTYVTILKEARAAMGYKTFQSGPNKDYFIPAHSHILGAWVEGGLAGGIFWLYILIYAVVSLLRVSGREPLLPFFAFSGFLLIWNILFSPISPDRRFVTPYFIVGMILLRSFRNSRTFESERI
jgi:hypothetical protein